MKNKIIKEEVIVDTMRDGGLTPVDFITLMFDRTDSDGILYIPGWQYSRPGWQYDAPGSSDENDSYRCKIDWNLEKYEKVQEDFEKLYNDIKELSKYFEELTASPEKAEEVLKDTNLLDTWNTYLKPFDCGEFDTDKTDEIYDKLDTIAWVKSIAEKISKGQKIEKFEKEILNDYIDVAVSKEEMEYRKAYLRYLRQQAHMRVGGNICAKDVIMRAIRMCRLFVLGAPEIVIKSEGSTFAAAFVLHECGISREVVDDNIRLRIEQMELMSDEELDELYRPQKTNSRKSLAPLFVYEILSKNSSSKKHLRQNDILNKLTEYPYEITLERKALSRIIHNLADSTNYAIYQDKNGVWIEQEGKQ